MLAPIRDIAQNGLIWNLSVIKTEILPIERGGTQDAISIQEVNWGLLD